MNKEQLPDSIPIYTDKILNKRIDEINSYVDLIGFLTRRPEMYLGSKSIQILNAFLNGWDVGRKSKISDGEILSGFQPWIENKFTSKTTHHWSEIILYYNSCVDYKAFDDFIKLWNEYLQEIEESK